MELKEIREAIKNANCISTPKIEISVKVEDLVSLEKALTDSEVKLRQCQQDVENLKKELKREKDKEFWRSLQKDKEENKKTL